MGVEGIWSHNYYYYVLTRQFRKTKIGDVRFDVHTYTDKGPTNKIENDYYVFDIDITDNIIEFFIQRKVLLMNTSFASRFNFVVKISKK